VIRISTKIEWFVAALQKSQKSRRQLLDLSAEFVYKRLDPAMVKNHFKIIPGSAS